MVNVRTTENNGALNIAPLSHAGRTCLAILDRAAASIKPGLTEQVMNTVVEALRDAREEMSAADWTEFGHYVRAHHALRYAMYQDPMTLRAFEQPRGYAGDAVMMDYLYGIHYSYQAVEQATPLGREVYQYVQGMDASQAVRYRREHIAQLIDAIAATRSNPRVLAIAAGHLREAELSMALAAGRVGRFVAFDADAASLQEIETHYSPFGVETVHGSVRHILARMAILGTFDFVYAAGLYDYLADNVAQALSARMFEMVEPGGIMLIPNFAPQIRARDYMEAFMDWRLIYRDEYDMALLVARIDPTQIESYDVYSDPAGSVVYLLVKKAAR